MEFDAVSLLCPTESEDWADCATTSSTRKLTPYVAQKQLGVVVPTIPASYLSEEFEARTRPAGVLNSQVMIELQFHNFS